MLSGILSAEILAASVTPFVSKSHIEKLNAGGNHKEITASATELTALTDHHFGGEFYNLAHNGVAKIEIPNGDRQSSCHFIWGSNARPLPC